MSLGCDDENIDESAIEANVDVLNDDFENYGIQFEQVDITRVCESDYLNFCSGSPPCCDTNNLNSSCNFGEYREVQLKQACAVDPDEILNVFIVNRGSFAVYPWSVRADTATGGIFINPSEVGGEGDCSGGRCFNLSHEVGHALGLWHTQEWTHLDFFSSGCDPCGEPATCNGSSSAAICNESGDLCSDTPATLRHACVSVTGDDTCTDGDPEWPEADVGNRMGYGDQNCVDHFTPQQARRMHCWVCNAVPGWIDSPDCNTNDIPDVCEITRGDKTDCDENGILDECEDVGSCCLPLQETCWTCVSEATCDLEANSFFGPVGGCFQCALLP